MMKNTILKKRKKIDNSKKRKNDKNVCFVKYIVCVFAISVGMLSLSACSMPGSGGFTAKKSTNSSAVPKAVGQTEQDDAQSTADIVTPNGDGTYYMIVKNDIQNYQITLMNLTNAEQICYEYTDGTEFFDKYGNYALNQEFTEGKLAVIVRLNSNDTLGAIAFTDETWDYENVRNYSMDLEKNRMEIADTSYQLDTFARVFSDGEQTEFFSIGDSDLLNVYGIGRTVYSIVVENGHGTLALTNTDLFEGGWMNLGTKVYTKVTKNMTLELPEGIYDFSVANDGYGDSGEVRIRRDKTTTIDLNDYKGEGPKLCEVTFDVGVEGAVLTVDGKKVKHSKPLELRYGVHTLGVYAEGYDAWTKQLVINSPKANIEIALSADSNSQANTAAGANQNPDTKTASNDASDSNSQNNTNKTSNQSGLAGSKAGSRAGSYTGNSSDSSTGNSDRSVSSALANAALGSSLASVITGGDSTDYLDTLSDLVDSLEKLNRSSSD